MKFISDTTLRLLLGIFSLVSLNTAAGAAVITVNSIADPGAPNICALRDAIAAANSKSPVNGCSGGTGSDTIQFSVCGTIAIMEGLPQITDANLTIKGPIKITTGAILAQELDVGSFATLHLDDVTMANGGDPNTAAAFTGIVNEGTLTVAGSTFSGNSGGFQQLGSGCIFNQGTASVTNSTFSGNSANGAIINVGTLTVTDTTFSDMAMLELRTEVRQPSRTVPSRGTMPGLRRGQAQAVLVMRACLS